VSWNIFWNLSWCESLQGNYLKAVAMKTTPTEALEVTLCSPFLD